MANRVKFENSSDIGAFCCLTNSFCLVSAAGKEGFFNVFESELEAVGIPVIRCSIGGGKIIGNMVVGKL